MKLSPSTIIFVGLFLRIIYGIFEWNNPHLSFSGQDIFRFMHLALPLLEGFDQGVALGEDRIPVEQAEYKTWGMAYVYFIAFIFNITTDSLGVLYFLSALSWLMSSFVFLKILDLLKVTQDKKNLALLIYVFLPSSLFITGTPLREAHQLLFVNLCIFFALKAYFYKDIRYWFGLTFSIFINSLLHPTFIVFGGLLFFVTLISSRFRSGYSFKWSHLYVFGFIALFASYLSLNIFSLAAYDLTEGFGVAITAFSEGAIETGQASRAQYKTSLIDLSENNFFGILGFLIYGFIQYLFEPFPWKIANILDLGLFIENILRASMIFIGLKILFFGTLKNKVPLFLIITSFFILEALWSIGSTNWGTAVRHHVPAMGLLILSGLAFTNLSIKRVSQ